MDPAIRLVATDLDGTLLDAQSRIPERTRRALEAAHDVGLLVIPATGRPPQALWPVVDGFRFGPMAVCSNGAVLVDIERRAISFTHPAASSTPTSSTTVSCSFHSTGASKNADS